MGRVTFGAGGRVGSRASNHPDTFSALTPFRLPLTQLVDAYESQQDAADTSASPGLDALEFLLGQNHMSGSDLARLLGLHASTGSKILKGERKLTADHLRTLSERFHFESSLFL